MTEYLVRKNWGYQTCCPDEENIIGYFKPDDHEKIEFYPEPDFNSEPLKKVISNKHEDWKYMVSDSLKCTLAEMDKKYGNMYEVEGLDNPVHTSNCLWGWKEIKDKENRITWIKVSNYEEIWAPFDDYDSDEDSNSEIEKYVYENDDKPCLKKRKLD
jgi:hypothetical protein